MRNIKFLTFDKTLFFAFFIIYLAAAWYVTFYLSVYHIDTVSRSANAFFTVFGRQPHLAAIGFVWLPLPSLLQIPFLTIFYHFGLQMLSAPLITSFFGALTVVVIYKISMLLGRGKRSRLSILVTVLYGLNPMIILYAAIGSSETIFISSLLLFSYFFLKWFLKSGIFDLALSAFALVFALGSRFESIPVFMAGTALVLAIGLSKKSPLREIQAKVVLFGLPFVYFFMMWLLVNWIIMGDPLYFWNSPYSYSGYTDVIRKNSSLLENSYHSLNHSILYASKRILFLAPGLILLPLVLFRFVKDRKEMPNSGLLLMVLLVPYISILLFHVLELYYGQSLGWLRFYIYSVIAITLMALYFDNYHKVFKYLVVISLFLGFITTAYAMGNINYGKEEAPFVRKIENKNSTVDYSRTFADQKAVAAFMNGQKGKILLDTYDGFAVFLFTRNPKQCVINSDIDFRSALENYQTSVNWVIIPNPGNGLPTKNIINIKYPQMWSGKMSSVSLYKQIADWRIYKVIKSRESRSSSQ